jgi:OmpA-OmpF porin, OOP family
MNKILCSFLLLLLGHIVVVGQDNNDHIQAPTLGIQFTMHDFASAANIRTNSLGVVLKDRQFGKVKNMSAGLALNYINGINSHFDFSGTLGGTFLAYPFRDETALSGDHFLVEATASVRGKMTSNQYWLNPYLQAGVGASTYSGYYGAFIPIGAGMQFNLGDEAFVLVNMQYRIPVTQTVNYHFLLSIGIAGKIADRKKK